MILVEGPYSSEVQRDSHILWPSWAADRTHARLHRLSVSRAAPVVCIQEANPPWTKRGPSTGLRRSRHS
jgi:hypothetical protein